MRIYKDQPDLQGLEFTCSLLRCLEAQALNRRERIFKRKKKIKKKSPCTRLTSIGKPRQKQEQEINQASWEL